MQLLIRNEPREFATHKTGIDAPGVYYDHGTKLQWSWSSVIRASVGACCMIVVEIQMIREWSSRRLRVNIEQDRFSDFIDLRYQELE